MGNDWDDLRAVKRANRGSIPNFKRPEWENSKAPKFNLSQPAFDLSAASNRSMQTWHVRWLQETLRLLKPGGPIKVFGGTRTFHRLAAAMEEAGFSDVRVESWSYGSGFPKSHDVGRNIDRIKGCQRKVLNVGKTSDKEGSYTAMFQTKTGYNAPGFRVGFKDEPASPEAWIWDGWATAQKPAWEPVLVGVKPA